MAGRLGPLGERIEKKPFPCVSGKGLFDVYLVVIDRQY
jgi:hypothetical protein